MKLDSLILSILKESEEDNLVPNPEGLFKPRRLEDRKLNFEKQKKEIEKKFVELIKDGEFRKDSKFKGANYYWSKEGKLLFHYNDKVPNEPVYHQTLRNLLDFLDEDDRYPFFDKLINKYFPDLGKK
jgi:hypothetical protein